MMSDTRKPNIAETNLYCPKCGSKIYDKGEKLRHIAPFTGNEEKCSICDTTLRRRSPGGQSNKWNFITYKTLRQRLDACSQINDNAVRYIDKQEVEELLRAMFAEFPKTVDYDTHVSYVQALYEWVARWRL
jgi:hypothetical protein